MKDFLKYTLASMVGFILANIILGIIFTIIFLISVGSVMTMTKDFQSAKKVEVEEKSILHVKLNYPIAERTIDDPIRDFLRELQDSPKPMAIRDVLSNIAQAKKDEKIKGIVLQPGVMQASYADLQDIRKELKAFKESGKFLYAYSNAISQKGYYLANVADSIFLQPEGMMQFTGMNSEAVFYKGLFDKLGITPHVFKAGKYKSAGESFTQKEMTKPEREQTRALLNTMHNQFLSGISETRNISTTRLQTMIDSVTIRTAEDAVKHGLADKLFYKDQLKALLRKKVNQEKDQSLNLLALKKYQHAPSDKDDQDTDNRIAVIYANGGIGMGEGGEESIGSERLSKAIRKARRDDNVQSIVLRVNSPGGSALASDIIWREVKLASNEKPLVVSMGNLAASGGYYISAPADTIMAQPSTITGSIGVIGLLFDWEKFWNEKTGITFDRVKTGKYADLGNPNRPITKKEKMLINQFLMETYDDFITHVSEGRNMDKGMVDSLGRGRVWSGKDAKRVGLVDLLGGFEKAIQTAAKMAELEKYETKAYPEVEDAFEKIMKSFSSSVATGIFGTEIKQKLKRHDRLKLITREGNGAYMLMPYDFRIN